MSDQTPDPIDRAYAEAEAVLSDEPARAARRARVLAAVAGQGAPGASAARPSLWRRGGWLVAASVSGLALVLANRLYRPPPPPLPSHPAIATAAPAATSRTTAAFPEPPAASPTRVKAQAARSELRPLGAAPPVAPASGAPSEAASAPRAFPVTEPAPSPPPPEAEVTARDQAPLANQPDSLAGGVDNRAEGKAQDLVVVAEKREPRESSVPVAISAFTGAQRDLVGAERRDEEVGARPGAVSAVTPSARYLADPGARLRAAAAAGRTTEVEALLRRGAPVDLPDAGGVTALMKSIEADHPAAAAALLRHGASLDRENNAGKSARDLAAEKKDPKLDRAIGVGP